MKTKIFRLLTISAMMMLSMASCSKYDEGPKLSLRTKKARLCQRWKLTQQVVNGNNIDITTFFQSYEFKKNEAFSSYALADGMQYDGNGTWEFNQHKDVLYLTFDTGGFSKLEIKRLTKKELWLEFVYTDQEGENSVVENQYELRK